MRPAVDEARRRWVIEHRIWGEVVPSDPVRGHRDDWGPAGLYVRLYARCPEACRLDPCAPGCREVHERLAYLLEAALPAGLRCRVLPPEPALHLRPEAELAPEVELVAEIDKEGEPLGTVDASERLAVIELLENLAAQGVHRRGPAVAR